MIQVLLARILKFFTICSFSGERVLAEIMPNCKQQKKYSTESYSNGASNLAAIKRCRITHYRQNSTNQDKKYRSQLQQPVDMLVCRPVIIMLTSGLIKIVIDTLSSHDIERQTIFVLLSSSQLQDTKFRCRYWTVRLDPPPALVTACF